MKKLKNKNSIIVDEFIAFFIISILFIIISYCIMNTRYLKYTRLMNNTISEIVANVKEKYPDVSEEKIISDLKEDNYNIDENNFLNKYGYIDDIVYLNSLRQEFKKSNITYLATEILFILIIFTIVIVYILKENKKIQDINDYLKKVNDGKYELAITENSNDELSKLRNEIYKTTVLFRETAESSKKESKELSDSLADISHQLKTPLTSIRIMIDNIEENPDMDENTRKDFIKTISRQVDWMSSLVISLLKLSRFDAGMITMNDNEIYCRNLLENVIQNLSILIEIKNINISLKVPENAKFIADYNWQLEALTNIVKNAIEHSNENSKINIDVEDSSVFIKIIIQDNGEGINKADIKHIFERFYKAKNSSENSIGIGLALAKKIIENDNGYISVKSQEGKGTEFIVKYLK